MPDPRVRAYAELLVETCVDVQPGWQVMLLSSPLARPLVEEVAGCVARRGAFVIQRLDFTGATGGGVLAWIREAPDELLDQLPSIDRYTIENMDAAIAISAPENTREAT